MCGIIGYAGPEPAVGILLDALQNLEYRGYDSAGVSVCQNGTIKTFKTKGRLENLRRQVTGLGELAHGTVGIGHTRWATHGEPSDINSHPHTTPRLSLVHNGIIENYLSIKAYLSNKGYAFESGTDTEIAAKLIDSFLTEGLSPEGAIREAVKIIEGAYAFGVIFAVCPDVIYGIRKGSPLIIGAGGAANYLASDIPAILNYTRDYYTLEEGELAIVAAGSVEILSADGTPVTRQADTADWEMGAARKDGYDHFMLKEIHEQPEALKRTLSPRIKGGLPDFRADGLGQDFFGRFREVHIAACGTAGFAGSVTANLIERLGRVPCRVSIASEFRYSNPILAKDTLVILVSQSGETADTLAALRLAKAAGVTTLAVVNVAGSAIATEADYCIMTYAGPEISVASTKAFTVQVGVGCLIAIKLALDNGAIDQSRARELTAALSGCSGLISTVLGLDNDIRRIAAKLYDSENIFYIGRGLDCIQCLEGALKLKEISYIHCEAYAAGELKHGTISLITNGTPVVALATQSALVGKMVSNVKEVKARGAVVMMIAACGVDIPAEDDGVYDYLLKLPQAGEEIFMPIVSAAALQLFAYHMACLRGCDVDKPRNLAKCVTVE